MSGKAPDAARDGGGARSAEHAPDSDLEAVEAARRTLVLFENAKRDGWPYDHEYERICRALLSVREKTVEGLVGELLTAEQLMNEVTAYCEAAGNSFVGIAIRDGFEGRGRAREKGVLVHAIRASLKVEEVKMYRRIEPKQAPPIRSLSRE